MDTNTSKQSPSFIRASILVGLGMIASFAGASIAVAGGQQASVLVELPSGQTELHEVPAAPLLEVAKAPNCHKLLTKPMCVEGLATDCYCGYGLSEVPGLPEHALAAWIEE